MKRNFVKEIINNLSSGKDGRVRRWALCSLRTAVAFGLASAVVLPVVTVEPCIEKIAVQGLEETDGSYKVETNGFVTTISVENMGGYGLAEMGERLLFASAGEPHIDMEKEGETSEGIQINVEPVTEGDDYNAFVAQLPGDTNSLMPVQIMKVTASRDGEMIDLSGWKIKMQISPTEDLIQAADGKLGMSIKAILWGDEATVEPMTYTNVQMQSGEPLSPMDVIYTVPEGGTAMYALSSSAVYTRKLEGNENWTDVVVVEDGENVNIDLNGYTITRVLPDHTHIASCYNLKCTQTEHTHTVACEEWGWKEGDVWGFLGYNKCGMEQHVHTNDCYDGEPICGLKGHVDTDDCYDNGDAATGTLMCKNVFFVKSGGVLTVEDSRKEGSITAQGLEALIAIKGNGELNIKGGKLENIGGQRVILAWETGTVNMSGGTVTGATAGVWGGAGIYTWDGEINLSGGIITGNIAGDKGGGIYVEDKGTVNVTGGEISRNSAHLGGGICLEKKGTVNISGGVISGNNAYDGAGIYAGVVGSCTVNISNGAIKKNVAENYGGGIYVKGGKVTITGGTIGGEISETINEETGETISETITDGNEAIDGGGIYVEDNADKSNIRVIVKGNALISGNKAKRYGGGVWAGWIDMSAGTITKNRSGEAGAGVYAISMKMTGGTISHNKVKNYSEGYTPKGGGGIYITTTQKDDKGKPVIKEGDYVCTFEDEETKVNIENAVMGGDITEYVKTTINGNMSITGGTIEGNESCHTGGGIFVDIGAVAYISGTDANIYIRNNKAFDKSPGGQGYAGGGVFVEHPDAKDPNGTAEQGGKAYIYNAVITQNTAKYGGGVAGCGTSNVTICSVNGVAVYGNYLDGTGSGNIRYSNSKDLYIDGAGMVDSSMMGCAQVTWKGKYKTQAGTEVPENAIQPSGANLFTISSGVRSFTYGFYLHVEDNSLTQQEKDEINSYATVFIQNNTSKSGGGGVGGNGYMKLGLKSPKPDTTYALEFKKIVEGRENSDNPPTFNFTVTLKNKEGVALVNTYPYYKYNKESQTWAHAGESIPNENGEHSFTLANEEHIRIGEVNGDGVTINGLPEGTLYTIKEVTTEGYEPSFEVKTGDWVKDYTKKDEVSGRIIQNNFVVFTNTALYQLPETGGETTAMYYVLGCILLATAMVGGWMYKKRSKSKSISSGH